MMTAEEARKITFEAKDEVVKDAITVLHDRVKSNAKRGIPQATMEFYRKIPFTSEIIDGIVEHFENLGFSVSVEDLVNNIKITVSWWEE